MPIYLYKNPKSGKVKEVIQRMNEDHVYFDESGLQWERVFTVPQASVDSQINPSDAISYVEKTKNMKGSYGDLMDYSKELSEKRAEKNNGIDPLKKKAYEEYSKKRRGIKHPQEIKENAKKFDGANIEF